MKKTGILLCIILITISFCACGNKSPAKRLENKYNIKLPSDMTVEYNYEESGNFHGDNPGWYYTVFKLNEEPTELLNSLSFKDKAAHAEVTHEDVPFINDLKQNLEQKIPAYYHPIWTGHFLAANSPCIILYFPDILKLIIFS